MTDTYNRVEPKRTNKVSHEKRNLITDYIPFTTKCTMKEVIESLRKAKESLDAEEKPMWR